jgi:hypothetical protein
MFSVQGAVSTPGQKHVDPDFMYEGRSSLSRYAHVCLASFSILLGSFAVPRSTDQRVSWRSLVARLLRNLEVGVE